MDREAANVALMAALAGEEDARVDELLDEEEEADDIEAELARIFGVDLPC